MYSHEINEMANELLKAGVVADADKAADVLRQYWGDKIALVWCVDDVKSIADSEGIEVTDEEAMEVLLKLKNNHDASRGVCWDDIVYTLAEMK
jgi:hypothetical protein